MNKLTKILIIVAISSVFLDLVMGFRFNLLAIPVICAAAYLISKVMGDGPRIN